MALYKIQCKKSATKEFRKIDGIRIPEILSKIESFSSNPRPSDIKKLKGSDHTRRIRVGEYRVVTFEWIPNCTSTLLSHSI